MNCKCHGGVSADFACTVWRNMSWKRERGAWGRKVWKVRESSRMVGEKVLESVFTDINRLGQFKN
jgi:hypothetical protein